jgi:splicing factor 3B subunit 3
MYALCGRGNRSSLRVLRYGLPVDDFTKGAALPGVPTQVWSIRTTTNDEHHAYIVVSFVDSTLVLEVGDNVKEVKDSGFAGQKRTLSVVTLADNAGHAQVHPEGILMVLPGGQEKTEWKTPLGKQVVCSSANGRQIAVGLEGGTIVYFEMGPNGQMLNSGTYDVGSEITCVHHVSVFSLFFPILLSYIKCLSTH